MNKHHHPHHHDGGPAGWPATAAMTAAGMAAAKNSRKVKKMAKKVGRGAQQAVLDLDKGHRPLLPLNGQPLSPAAQNARPFSFAPCIFRRPMV